MKKILILFCFSVIFSGTGMLAQDSIHLLLPDNKCASVSVIGEPELYRGDELFNLINGGAELYHEYGFVEVIAAELLSGKLPLQVEIYDMGSQESAWGIFSLTATGNAIGLNIGDTARKGLGFLQCIKDRFMLYFYYEGTDDKALNKAAGCILKKIIGSSTPPYPMEILEKLTDPEARIKYFRGNLGLSSVYNFHYKDVFGYLEGASAEIDDVILILLRYRSAIDAHKKFPQVAGFFMQSNKYENRVFNVDSFHVLDKKLNQVDCHLIEDFVIVLIYPPAYDIDDARLDLMEAIK